MDDLQARLDALFLEELQDGMRVLADGVTAFTQRRRGVEAEDVANDDLVRRLFRAAHSLKGAAHSAGVSAAIGPCHRMEELLAEVRSGDRPIDSELTQLLDADLDELGRLHESLLAGVRDDDDPSAPPPSHVGEQSPPLTAVRPVASESRARIAVGRLDQLVDRTSALLSASGRVSALVTELTAASDARSATKGHRAVQGGDPPGHAGAADLTALLRRAVVVERDLQRLAMDIADTAQQLRLQPLSDVTVGLERSVRELCEATGTEARLVTTGMDVEVDRDIGDALRDVLLHLVRNAVDHGIEPADRRAYAGKPPTGTVRLDVAVEATQVAITVSDDGAGISLDAVRDAAVAMGIDATQDAEELPFRPGVSTSATVTAVSGRGVGLDAVRATVEGLGGTVQLRSRLGQGTQVHIHMPRSLAVLRVVIVGVDDQIVALPSSNLGRLHPLAADDIEHLEGRISIRFGDAQHPAVPLGGALGLTRAALSAIDDGLGVEVLGEQGLLIVDTVDSELDVVVKPLPGRMRTGSMILGAALLPSGQTVLITNPSAALRTGLTTVTPPIRSQPAQGPVRVLVAEDTPTTRALERSILEGAGYEVVVAADGAEALALLHEQSVDIVVSDVDMPRMDGIDLCRSIRSTPRLADIPVVLVTSLAREDDRARGVDAGANAYIVKSAFEQQVLLDAVRRLT